MRRSNWKKTSNKGELVGCAPSPPKNPETERSWGFFMYVICFNPACAAGGVFGYGNMSELC